MGHSDPIFLVILNGASAEWRISSFLSFWGSVSNRRISSFFL